MAAEWQSSCASCRPRHSPGAGAAVGDLRAEAVALLPRRPAQRSRGVKSQTHGL